LNTNKFLILNTRIITLFFGNIFIRNFYRMKDSLIKQCLDILKTEDVRNEIKVLFSPVTDLILYEIYPYIYVIIFLVFLIFVLILANLLILVTLLRNKNVINTFR